MVPNARRLPGGRSVFPPRSLAGPPSGQARRPSFAPSWPRLHVGRDSALAINPSGTNGLIHGNSHFFLVQLGAVCLSSVWAFVFTYGMLWVIDRITTVKVDEAGETEGLDSALHGEVAYVEAF